MINITVPEKLQIDDNKDIKEHYLIKSLMLSYGYVLTYIGTTGVVFHLKKDEQIMDDKKYIPLSSHYRFSKKNFAVFLESIKRLDEAEKKLEKFSNWVSG